MNTENEVVLVDGELLAIIPQFFQNIRDEIEELREEGSGQNMTDLAIFGHSLKGTGAAYGFPCLTDLGKELETVAKAGDFHGASERLEAIISYTETVSYAAK